MNTEAIRKEVALVRKYGFVETSSDLVLVEACEWLLEENERLKRELEKAENPMLRSDDQYSTIARERGITAALGIAMADCAELRREIRILKVAPLAKSCMDPRVVQEAADRLEEFGERSRERTDRLRAARARFRARTGKEYPTDGKPPVLPPC